MLFRRILLFPAILIWLFASACAPPQAPSPASPWGGEAARTHTDTIPMNLPAVPSLPAGWTPLRCPTQNRRSQQVIPVQGGLIGVDIAHLTIPANALDRPVRFTITEAQNTVEVAIEADVGNVVFRDSAELMMSYARCPMPLPTPNKSLAIWRYRPRDGWQRLGGAIDPNARTITVRIDSISRFLIAEG